MNKRSNQKQKIIDKVVIHVRPDPDDDTDIQTSNKQNVEHIKDQVQNILDYQGNTTEYAPDGTIVITPRYLVNLPNEILDIILFYLCHERKSKIFLQSLQTDLYQCSLINKQFYQKINPLLWHTPVILNAATLDRFVTCLTNTPTESDNLAISKTKSHYHHTVNHNVFSGKHHIRRLDIRGGSGWDDIQFSLIMPSLILLETLTIDYYAKSKVTDASLHYLPRYCPNLSTLSFVPTSAFTKRFIDSIIQTCPRLSRVELYISYDDLHPGIFKSLLKCRSLTTMVFEENNEEKYHVNGIGKNVLNKGIVTDMLALNQLTSLVFLGRGYLKAQKKIFDIIYRGINPEPWPLLPSLRIHSGGFPLGDGFMTRFVETHPNLTCLDLTDTFLSDTTLDTIATHLPGLTHLRLASSIGITENGVYKLVRRCQNLKQADFPHCNLRGSMVEFSTLTIADMDKIRQLGNSD